MTYANNDILHCKMENDSFNVNISHIFLPSNTSIHSCEYCQNVASGMRSNKTIKNTKELLHNPQVGSNQTDTNPQSKHKSTVTTAIKNLTAIWGKGNVDYNYSRSTIWTGLSWAEHLWARLGSSGLGWTPLGWAEHIWAGLSTSGLDWAAQGWAEHLWAGLGSELQ